MMDNYTILVAFFPPSPKNTPSRTVAMEPTWWTKAQTVAREALCSALTHLDDAQKERLRGQEALFLDQLDHLSRLQQDATPCTPSQPVSDGKTPHSEITPKKPEEVEDKLREIFSVTDRLSYHEVNAVAKQLGICGDTIVSFIYKSQLELEQVLESCRLQCPVPSKVIDRESAVKSTIPVQGSQHVEGSCKESAALGSEPGPLLQNQDVQSGKRRLSSLDDVERNEGEFGAKRNCRRSSNISPSQAEAGSSAAPTSANRDNEKIIRLRELQCRSGGLKDAAGAGSMLMVMREEASFVVRAALLTIIQKTHKDAFLERLVGGNLMFCKVMEKWINEGTKQHKTDFLKQLVSVLGHLPLKQDHIKNSRIQTLIARLANKYADSDLNRIAGELVNRYQNLRQGLSPSGQSKGPAHGSVLERLQSGEAQQKGKAFFLSGDELRRPSKRVSLVKQRPLTTDEIVEKQQRHRYLNQASTISRSQSMGTPDKNAEACMENPPRGQTLGSSQRRNELSDGIQNSKKTQRTHHDCTKRETEKSNVLATPILAPTSGTIVRWMKETPSDLNFYEVQQQLYLTARTAYLSQEKSMSEIVHEQTPDRQASLIWSTPPLVKGVCSSIALGESSTEKDSPKLPNKAVEPCCTPAEMSLDPPGEAKSHSSLRDISEIPFAPCDHEEFEDQEKKLKEKGVRNPVFVAQPSHAQTSEGPIQQNRSCITPLQRTVRAPKLLDKKPPSMNGQGQRPIPHSRQPQLRQGTPLRFRNTPSQFVRRPRGQERQSRGPQTNWRGGGSSQWNKPNESAMGH